MIARGIQSDYGHERAIALRSSWTPRTRMVRCVTLGPMGEVWVAHHRTPGEDVALKVLSDAPASGVARLQVTQGELAASRLLLFDPRTLGRARRGATVEAN